MKKLESKLFVAKGCLDCEKFCKYSKETVAHQDLGSYENKPYGCNSVLQPSSFIRGESNVQ